MKQNLINLHSLVLLYLLCDFCAENLDCNDYGHYHYPIGERLVIKLPDDCCLLNTSLDINSLNYMMSPDPESDEWAPFLGWREVIENKIMYIHHYFYYFHSQGFIAEKYSEIIRMENNKYHICVKNESKVSHYTLQHLYNLITRRSFINFTHTGLEELSVHGWSGIYIHVPRLKRLHVKYLYHFLDAILSFSKETQKSVTYLHVGNSFFSGIYEYGLFISQFPSLKELSFSHSSTFIPVTDVQLSSVTTLDYSHAGIEVLEENTFSSFASVSHLNLTGNKIKSIHENSFLHFIYLKEINISNSLDTDKLSLQFRTMKTIELIDLSKNLLTSVDISFDKGVKSLNLSHNNLSEISVKCCSAKTCVMNINLQNNLIEINEEFLTSAESAKSVDINNYKLNCLDCDMLKSKVVIRFIENSIDTRFFFHTTGNMLACTEPTSYSKTFITDIMDIKRICKEESIYKKYWKSHKILIISLVTIFSAFILLITTIAYKYHFEIHYWIQYIRAKRRMTISCCDLNGFDYDVFISYCAADRMWVWNVLKKGLEQCVQRYCLYLHERDFLLRIAVDEDVENSMKKSKYCITIVSNNFIANKWCKWELEVASTRIMEERSKFLILIQLGQIDTSNLPAHLKHLISTRTYLEWNTKKFSEESLLKRLTKALGESIYEKNLQARFDIDESEI